MSRKIKKIELLCIDTDGTLTDGSIIYGFTPHFFNSSLELHSADFGIFGASQTPSLVSAPKIPKNYESQTENPSVVDSLHESNKNSDSHTNPPKTNNRSNCGGGFVFAEKFGCETRLGVCEHSKFGKSMQDAPKSELKTSDTQICEVAKVFNVKDGLALAYWAKTLNRKVAIITGRSSEILRARAKELGIDELLFMGIRDKGAKVRELKERFALTSSQIATIGDDLNDIPMFSESLCNFAPSDCADALKALPNTTILNAKGGKGAVREAIEIILKKENLYEAFVSQFV